VFLRSVSRSQVILFFYQQFQIQNVAQDTEKLKVLAGKGFAMKIANEETRKNLRQREKLSHQA